MNELAATFLSINKQSIRFAWCASLLFLLHISLGFCQERSFTRLDTFSPERHSGEAYAMSIRAVRNTAIDSGSYNNISLFDSYVDKLDNYDFENKVSRREAYMRHGFAYNKYLRNLYKAEKYYLKAYHVLNKEELNTDKRIWFVENPLASINNQLGELDKSLYFYELAEKALAYQQDKRLCRLLGNKGILLQTLLKNDEARKTYLKGLALSRKYNYKLGEAMNRINLNALNIQEGLYNLAQLQLDTLTTFLDDERIRVKIYDAVLDQQASLAYIQGDYHQAIKQYKNELIQLDKIYSTSNRREYAKIHNKLAEVYLKIERHKDCRQAIQTGLKCLVPDATEIFIENKDLYEENTFMDLYGTLGELFAKQYQASNSRMYLDSAFKAYDLALLVNDLLVAQFTTDESKYTAAHENGKKVANLFEVIWQAQQSGFPISTYQLIRYAQESKSMVFHEAIDRRQKYDLISTSDQQAIQSNQLKLTHLQSAFHLSADERLRIKLKLNKEINQLTNNINIQTHLLQSPYVNYIIAADHIYSIDNLTGQIRLSQLSKIGTFQEKQSEFLKLIVNERSTEEIKDIGNQLYNTLLRPLGTLPEKFTIVPHGILHFLPFDALVHEHGDWLIQDHQIDIQLSLRVIKGDDQTPLNNVTCILPDYGPDAAQMAYNRMDLFPLKYASNEINSIKEHFSNVKTVSTINVDELQNTLLESDIFHYTGHAQTDDAHGKLILSKDGNSISGTEIGSLFSTLSLAVLSACETGVGEIRTGEGSMSLARAFLVGGCKHTINSLWTVNDQTTSILMKHFYRNLKRSNNPSTSLRNAKIELLNQNQDLHPYFWSAFILTTVDAESTTKRFNPSLVFILLLVIVALIALSSFIKKSTHEI